MFRSVERENAGKRGPGLRWRFGRRAIRGTGAARTLFLVTPSWPLNNIAIRARFLSGSWLGQLSNPRSNALVSDPVEEPR